MRIPTAKKIAVSYELICPKCDETIAHPDSGSLFWMTAEIQTGKIVECFHCKAKVKLPKT